ncbi:hypothetical protein CDN99_13280 [Roseateles aquatilis]|uniref:Uncharacterized protein n=1 Tax=Roseateles aquatilis TaxID=431061 RepID=A0A246JCL5_9BURK|nr:hypothetical protein [Roseateles aquatilis]OWQ90334.1 hypothetical protein CDN99_13280 [Roseateles aquatilis]
MRHRIAPSAAKSGRHAAPRGSHQFSLVMQRILRQTEVLLQRRVPFSPSGWPLDLEPPALDGLEVTESTWDEWSEAMALQMQRAGR